MLRRSAAQRRRKQYRDQTQPSRSTLAQTRDRTTPWVKRTEIPVERGRQRGRGTRNHAEKDIIPTLGGVDADGVHSAITIRGHPHVTGVHREFRQPCDGTLGNRKAGHGDYERNAPSLPEGVDDIVVLFFSRTPRENHSTDNYSCDGRNSALGSTVGRTPIVLEPRASPTISMCSA